jgi:hypothetical protein
LGKTLELINIKLTLETEYQIIPPAITAKINERIFYNDVIKDSKLEISTTYHCKHNHDYCIQLIRRGKTDNCPEQLVNIVGMEIDNVNVRDIMWHTSVFRPEYPEPWASQQKQKGIDLEDAIHGETILGHNGIWEFEFSSPFYQFLIAKVRGQ